MTISAQNGEFAVALQYMKYDDGVPIPEYAYGSASFSGQPSDNDTITIGGVAYTFKNTIASANHVKIAATLRLTIKNLVAAATGYGGIEGTDYYAGTTRVLSMIVEAGDNAVYFTSLWPGQAGNALTLAKSSTAITLSGSTLSGGKNGGEAIPARGRVGLTSNPADTDAITIGSNTYTFVTALSTADDVLIGANAIETADNLVAAINGDAGEGSIYGTGTTANADITASRVGATVILKAITAGTAGNSLVLTESETSLSVTGSGTLTNGRAATEFQYHNLSWKRLPVRDADYAEQQMQEVFPPEVNRRITPFGAYKSGVAVGGGATMHPRLENSVGILLLAALGASSTSVSGAVGTHTFKFDVNNEANQPWVAVRRMIPGRDAIAGQGLIGYDNKVSALRMNLSAASLMEMRVDFMGRFPVLGDHPEAWSGSSFEDFESVPLACKGVFRFPTIPEYNVGFKATSVVIELVNNTTTPREEMVVGSYFMDDVLTRFRTLRVRVMHKYEGPAIYKYLFTGGNTGVDWNPQPFITEKDGSDYAFEARFEAPFNIPSTSTPYSVTVRAPLVYWEPQRPMVLQGGGIIMQEVVGTVLTPVDGSSYADFILVNGNTSGYAVPSEL